MTRHQFQSYSKSSLRLDMTLRFDYKRQPQLLEMILEKIAEEETGRLIILTSEGCVNLSGKVLQLYSQSSGQRYNGQRGGRWTSAGCEPS